MSILLNKIDKLIETGMLCVIYRKGVSDGLLSRIDARDEDCIQYTTFVWSDPDEIYSQLIMPISELSGVAFYIKEHAEYNLINAKQNSFKNI